MKIIIEGKEKAVKSFFNQAKNTKGVSVSEVVETEKETVSEVVETEKKQKQSTK